MLAVFVYVPSDPLDRPVMMSAWDNVGVADTGLIIYTANKWTGSARSAL